MYVTISLTLYNVYNSLLYFILHSPLSFVGPKITYVYHSNTDRDSVDGITIRYGVDGPGIEFQWRRDFPLPFTPDLGHTQRTVQRVPALSPGVQRLGCGVAPPPTRAEIKERVEIYVYALFGPSWSILG